MKRILSAILFIILLYSSVAVFAESQLYLSAKDVEIKNNRLFQVDIYVKSNTALAAATFDITYDTDMMEYRDVITDVSNSTVKAFDNSGTVKAVFLKDDGIETGNIKLFSIEFKSTNPGTSQIYIDSYNCVNNSAEELSIIANAHCTVTVAANSAYEYKGKNGSVKSEKSSKNSSTEEGGIIKYLSVAAPDNSSEKYYLSAIIVLIIIIALMSIYLRKQKKEKKKLPALQEEINDDEI